MSPSKFVALALVGSASAASLHRAPLRRQDSPNPTSASIPFVNTADPYNFNVVNLNGDDNIIYTANVTIDGQSFQVQLDTGSSDLWINTQNITLSPQANDTNITVTIPYADTTDASGDVFLAPVQFGNFSIPSQAFINAPGSNATYGIDLGLMGLAGADQSAIYDGLQNTTFNRVPPLYNIFASNASIEPYMTFLLARSDLGVTDGGIFTIGEVDPSWAAVQNATKIPVVPAEQGQWIGLMDGIIVDGKNFTGHGALSKVDSLPAELKEQTLSLLDSGTSLAVVPQYYWDAMYKDIPGLKVVNESQSIYSLPCETKRNVSVVFNGTEYPINPLDLTRVASLGEYVDGTNETICVNAFIAQDQSASGLDITLGDSFMRNAYALFYFGNWTDPNAPPAYMQLLSTTNQTAAWEQFDDLNNVRIQQWNQLGGQFNVSSATDAASTTSAVVAHRRGRKPRRAASHAVAIEDVAASAARVHEFWLQNY